MKRIDYRLAVGTNDGPRSSVWRYWSRNSEVYATHRGMGHVHKFSFHTPNLCRYALTAEQIAEHGVPSGLDGRAMHEWRRDATPESQSGRVVRVLRVNFPTDVLSTALETSHKPVSWIEPAPLGETTVFDLAFTRDTEATVREAVARDAPALNHRVVAYHSLPNGEAFYIASFFAPGTEEMLRVPASHGHRHDLIVSPKDPEATGRPVRLSLFSNPKDGDFIQVWELGGFWREPLTPYQWAMMRAAAQAAPENNRIDAVNLSGDSHAP